MEGGDGVQWIEWNIEKVQAHGVAPHEAEEVVLLASPPYPTYLGDGRVLVWGQTSAGDYLQVVYLVDEEGTTFVVHARPLLKREKQRLRRRRR